MKRLNANQVTVAALVSLAEVFGTAIGMLTPAKRRDELTELFQLWFRHTTNKFGALPAEAVRIALMAFKNGLEGSLNLSVLRQLIAEHDAATASQADGLSPDRSQSADAAVGEWLQRFSGRSPTPPARRRKPRGRGKSGQ